MRHVLLIGQRDSVLNVLLTHPAVTLSCCMAIAGSHLERSAVEHGIRLLSFDKRNKAAAMDTLANERFDLLISVGCPWLLPVTELQQQHPGALFANVHPSCLPRLRGNSPLNGAILFDEPCIGATVHWMDEHFDTGAIIAQVCIERTPDLDLGLLYAVSRMLEADALGIALDRLTAANFTVKDTPQQGEPTYYTRRPEDMQCDATVATTDELIRRVRAFGVPSQGCTINLADGSQLVALDAEQIANPYLHQKFRQAPAGSILMQFDERMLVRTTDGIVALRVARQ
ncbi:MAG: formyltransferase family protein [Chlorobi bacterium]|nr:formyltransferase family protein [Chlorobiota bacterium]